VNACTLQPQPPSNKRTSGPPRPNNSACPDCVRLISELRRREIPFEIIDDAGRAVFSIDERYADELQEVLKRIQHQQPLAQGSSFIDHGR
jgi:hypothetical protein